MHTFPQDERFKNITCKFLTDHEHVWSPLHPPSDIQAAEEPCATAEDMAKEAAVSCIVRVECVPVLKVQNGPLLILLLEIYLSSLLNS